ncbi:GntR family transcriptional regulator [Mesorhizobium sp. M1329]|uniref:GntR family transcriptional regulator n=1 Tax=Mesorhizobium sp. M1329 TaxID=2957083 RepID=UPI0033387FCC
MIQQRLDAGAIEVGNRLPSIRQVSAQTGYSMVTVHHAYSLLESEGVVRAGPRSGFYLERPPRPLQEFAAFTDEMLAEDRSPVAIANLTFNIMSSWTRPGLETFGSVMPSVDLFPEGDLNYFVRKILRHKVARARVLPPPELRPRERRRCASSYQSASLSVASPWALTASY